MKVLKICGSEWKNASRDERELSVCRELGAEAMVLAKGAAEDRGRLDEVDGFPVYRFTTRPLGSHFPNTVNRILSILLWAGFTRKLQPEVISGHDLIGSVVGLLSNSLLPRKKRAKLVYDAHEFELGRNVERSRLQIWGVKLLERLILNRCAFAVMVNDSIADEVQRIYRLKNRPVVVRSTPPYWRLNEEEIRKTRQMLLSALRAPDAAFLVMYHGSLSRGRGIEAMLDAIAVNQSICGVVLGNGESGYTAALRAKAAELGVEDRVLFHEAVSISELPRYVAAADLSLSIIEATAKNCYLSLPNKFFESIQALTPLVSSDFPERSRLVRKYGIGLTCDPSDVSAINDCIERFRTDKAFYMQCKEHLIKAKEELCWEREKARLLSAYRTLLDSKQR